MDLSCTKGRTGNEGHAGLGIVETDKHESQTAVRVALYCFVMSPHALIFYICKSTQGSVRTSHGWRDRRSASMAEMGEKD